MELKWLGLKSYDDALNEQKLCVEAVRETKKPIILACEHEPVITLGKRGSHISDVLTSIEKLREKKIGIVATDRGGQATFHNPGQLVIYPILPLRDVGLGVKNFVDSLERATAHLLAEHGLDVTHSYEPGLWVNNHKIAAFGIRVDRGVTCHGLAININNELQDFSLIRVCGQDAKVTNLRREWESMGMGEKIQELDLQRLAFRWNELFLDEVKSLT